MFVKIEAIVSNRAFININFIKVKFIGFIGLNDLESYVWNKEMNP